jgi:hypothetical protein
MQAGGWRETPSIKLSRLQPCQGRDLQTKGAKNTNEHNRKGFLFQLHHSRSVLHGGTVKQCGATAAASSTPCSCGRYSHSGKTECPGPYAVANCRLVLAPDVKSLPLDNMFRVVTVVQQIKTEFNGAVSEEAK